MLTNWLSCHTLKLMGGNKIRKELAVRRAHPEVGSRPESVREVVVAAAGRLDERGVVSHQRVKPAGAHYGGILADVIPSCF